jgi:hypothetical protein
VGWQRRDLEIKFIFMFEKISLEHIAIAFRTCSINWFFFQRNSLDYIKLGDATDGIWKFNGILLEQMTQEYRQRLL